jgi:oxygen-independent coproporphyrinogen-3 oxidase
VEANPEEVDLDFAHRLREAGVTRLSLGVQALDAPTLHRLGRRHTAEHVEDAFGAARASGFDEISCDLIFGVQGQSLHAWEETIRRLVRLGPEHISAYELRPGGGVQGAFEIELCEMMKAALEILDDQGYERYEVSNFALGGRRCLHNIGYWTGRDYVGLGAGAHSLYWKTRWANTASVEAYVHSVSAGLRPLSWSERLAADELLVEKVFLGVRVKEGLSLSCLASFWSHRLEETLDELCTSGLASLEDAALRLTENGLMLSDEVASQLVSACSR